MNSIFIPGNTPSSKNSQQWTGKTKRKFDYINAAQIVQDLMVKHGWIDDDNCTEMKPYFGNYVHQKDNPGVFIKVLK